MRCRCELKLLLCAALFAAADAVRADYLAWQVADPGSEAYALAFDVRPRLRGTAGPDSGDGGSRGGMSVFYVELVNFANARRDADRGGNVPYRALAPADGLLLDELPNLRAWHVGGVRATPEPTGAALALIGAAALGLRRRWR